MKLVLLFFCAVLGFLLLLTLLLLMSSIKLNIKECKVSNIEGNIKKQKVDKDFLIYLELYLFGIIKIAKIRLGQKIVQKIKEDSDIKAIEKEAKTLKKAHPLEIIKKLKIKLEMLNLYLEIGTESVIFTSYLVAAISAFIRYNIWNYKS